MPSLGLQSEILPRMETLSSGPEPSPARQAVLSVQKLSKRFGALAALNDLSFDVDKGEIFGIAGPNGAGKSTLLNVCTGALAQTSGRIFLDGERVDGLKPYRLCHKGLARTFQIPRLFESMTVHENVATGAMFGVGSESGDGMTTRQLVGDILALTGLLPSSDMPIASANLLTRKMTMLAAALATRPKLIFMDEPLAGLVSEEIDHLVELIAKLHGTLKIDFIVIEHKVRAPTRLCDRIMIMHYGSSICLDTPQKALRDKQVIEVYLGAEYFA
ncbi:MAG: ATP-binding cassette domain-containing protein [Methyloceanibacter sp.]